MIQGLLFFLPVLAIAAVLLTRRYPGERFVLKLRRAARRDPSRRAPSRPRARRPLILAAVRGGELIARSLAVRPPPAARAAAG